MFWQIDLVCVDPKGLYLFVSKMVVATPTLISLGWARSAQPCASASLLLMWNKSHSSKALSWLQALRVQFILILFSEIDFFIQGDSPIVCYFCIWRTWRKNQQGVFRWDGLVGCNAVGSGSKMTSDQSGPILHRVAFWSSLLLSIRTYEAKIWGLLKKWFDHILTASQHFV